MLLLLMSQFVFCDQFNYSSDDSICLANKFINKLREDTPFLYEDEVTFFGNFSLYSYVILHKLGYVDEQGEWIKPKPKYSYLCELIRINSHFILLKQTYTQYYFAGGSKTVGKDGLYDNSSYAYIGYVQEQHDYSSADLVSNAKSLIIRYNKPRKSLDFPMLIDGTPFLKYLGFISDSKGVPELGKDELDKLVKHISVIDK